ncbi:hypothetical protein [Peribacillus loiseleuriae]|nr:hypothetical protein [Peribacillus loiseleuriae]
MREAFYLLKEGVASAKGY